jgi:hypothetical protein
MLVVAAAAFLALPERNRLEERGEAALEVST